MFYNKKKKKNGSQRIGVLVLVDSHPIQDLRQMEWHLNGVMLEVCNLFHNFIFIFCKLLLLLILFFLLTEDDRVIDF